MTIEKYVEEFRNSFEIEDRDKLEKIILAVKTFFGLYLQDKDTKYLIDIRDAFTSEDREKFEKSLQVLLDLMNAKGSEWISNIDNETGECPVHGSTMVEIQLRGGEVLQGVARGWNWQVVPSFNSHYDIVTYRVLHVE